MKKHLLFTLFFCLALCQVFSEDAYHVHFSGVQEKDVLEILESASKTVELKESPSYSQAGLKRRATGDIPNLVKALQSLAYYNPKIDVDIDYTKDEPDINFKIDTGPIYTLESFEIISDDNQKLKSFDFSKLDLKEINITLEKPAFPENILESEENLINLLEKLGYPLAKITERQVIADVATRKIKVILKVETGLTCYFGPIKFTGLKRINESQVYNKIQWREGDVYDPLKVEKTQSALETTGLYRSININHADSTQENDMIPIEVVISEAKQRSIAAGISYSTDNGFGLLGEWEHRNVRGGNKIGVQGLLAQRLQEGSIAYSMPDFCYTKQDLIWLAEFQRQTTKGYHASSYSLSGIIERQLNENTRISYGGMFKRLRDTRSDNNGSFNLIKTPLQYRWRNTDSLLDPTYGQTLHIKITPSIQILKPQFAYCINTISGTMYIPFHKGDERLIFAAKGTLGSIFGNSRHTIPPSERFYAGNEHLLRGYHYMTVSPLRGRKPIGGRSLMIYSLEARFKLTDTYGWVLFYDFGNVYDNYLPQFNKKVLQSTGIGLRYNTPVGPLRLDFAVPLHRRKGIDESFQFYLSIGQSF